MNYLECKSKSLFSRTFVYFDKEPYYSDDIFERNNIRVRIEPMETGDFPYHIIFAKVAKKDVNKFIKSMDDLKKKMLICGNPDYVNVCDQMIDKIFNFLNEEAKNKELVK